MLGWSLVPLRWSEGCHWHLGNITHKQWIKHLAFAFVPFVHTLQTPGCSIIYGYLHVGNSVADMIGNAMGEKKNQPPKQMNRILNRPMERLQVDWKTLHMWFVNVIYTLVSLSSLLLAAPGWGALRRQLSVQGMSAEPPSYPVQDAAHYNGSSAAVLPLPSQDSDRRRVDGERDGCDSLYFPWKKKGTDECVNFLVDFTGSMMISKRYMWDLHQLQKLLICDHAIFFCASHCAFIYINHPRKAWIN